MVVVRHEVYRVLRPAHPSLRHVNGGLRYYHRPRTPCIATNSTSSPVIQPGSRNFQTTLFTQRSADTSQAHPLGDFYADLLAHPMPQSTKVRTELPNFVDTRGDLTKEERAAKLFGTIKGSGYERTTSQTPDATWKTINGVPIPPRPSEPENCCMSGCVHCVWDDYRDDIEQWAARLHEAQAKSIGASSTTTPKVDMSRPEVSNASISMDDDGGGSESLWTSPSPAAEEDTLFAGIPVGIREFMATEKRIRERKKAKRPNIAS